MARIREMLTAIAATQEPPPAKVVSIVDLNAMASTVREINNLLVIAQTDGAHIERAKIENDNEQAEISARLREARGRLAEAVKALGIKAEVVG